ncbi:MAG: 4Fe-4S binding protein [Gammaproteobacteria bacterium]|nr:4Fe-4S binding protein [Gammaproteobacteria bacterium]
MNSRSILKALTTTEQILNKAFPTSWNPLYSLGALCFYMFWIVTVSGLYLFIFFQTSIDGAWQSMEYITEDQWYAGGIARSLHRYASDALVVFVTLHMIRELILKRFQGARTFSWVSGVPLLWLMFAAGIGGYWLVWDERAQYIAITTAEFFDWINISTEPLAFGFAHPETLSDRFFSLLIFLHIGVPLALLLGMFIHIMRVSDSKSNPAKGLAIGIGLALLALSIIWPAESLDQADLSRSITRLGFDWFYLNFYPLINRWGAGPVWLMLLAFTATLVLLPFVFEGDKEAVAEVDPDFCNGCGWCYADCPYDAIIMKDHDYKKGMRQAVVLGDQCVSCGICAGACPSATPFKTINLFHSGINLPDRKIRTLLDDTREKLFDLTGKEKIVIFGCDHGTRLDAFADDSTITISLPCIAQLPPSYIDFLVKREHIADVLLTGCAEDNCFHRTGNDLMEQRVNNLRNPHIKTAAVRQKTTMLWSGLSGEKEVAAKLAELRSEHRARESNQEDRVELSEESS